MYIFSTLVWFNNCIFYIPFMFVLIRRNYQSVKFTIKSDIIPLSGEQLFPLKNIIITIFYVFHTVRDIAIVEKSRWGRNGLEIFPEFCEMFSESG